MDQDHDEHASSDSGEQEETYMPAGEDDKIIGKESECRYECNMKKDGSNNWSTGTVWQKMPLDDTWRQGDDGNKGDLVKIRIKDSQLIM